jgi:hypothetical protein
VRKGSIAQAERLGVKIKENFRGTGGKYYPHIKTIGIPSEKAAIKHINAWMSSFPAVNKWFKERGADNLGKETVSRVLRHEIGEAQAGARRLRTGRSESIITGKNQKAPRLGKAMETGGAKVFGLLRGITGNKRLFSDDLEHSGGIIHGHNANHYSPRIIFDDMRNSRMLSPQSQSMDFGGHAQSGALDMFKTTPDFLKHDGLFIRKRDIPALSAMVLDYNRTKTPWGATQEGVEQAARRAEQVGSSIRKFFTRVR